MRVHLKDLTGDGLEAAAAEFDDRGFFMLEGVGEAVTRHFRPLLSDRLQVSAEELERILDPDSPPVVLPLEIRQRLSRISSPPELRDALFSALGPVFARLIGPLAHISSTFHGQFKGGEIKPVDHGGYQADYLEVQGQYLLHQDFAGANIPTSPCAITLWVPQNSCPDFNLRLYPGSHRVGLICEGWVALDDPKLAWLGEPVDVVAEAGTAVIFNSLLLHGSSKPGLRRRVSCDIRFFPLCGFLPSEVHALVPDALGAIARGLAEERRETLRAPLLEDLAFLGQGRTEPGVRPHSILNWANYVATLLDGRPGPALGHFERFVNLEHGWDPVEKYTSKYHGRPIHAETLRTAARKVGRPGGLGPGFDRVIERAEAAAAAAE
jgi:hypothetical protein